MEKITWENISDVINDRMTELLEEIVNGVTNDERKTEIRHSVDFLNDFDDALHGVYVRKKITF